MTKIPATANSNGNPSSKQQMPSDVSKANNRRIPLMKL